MSSQYETTEYIHYITCLVMDLIFIGEPQKLSFIVFFSEGYKKICYITSGLICYNIG